MVLVQHIDNGLFHQKTISASVSAAIDDEDDDDYDHLFPNREYEHLCDCTYARVEPGEEDGVDGKEEAVWEESSLPLSPSHPSFGGDNSCDLQLAPCDGKSWNATQPPHPLPSAIHHRRAKSIDMVMVNRTMGYGEALKRRRQV